MGREDEEVEGEVEGPPSCILAEYQSMSQGASETDDCKILAGVDKSKCSEDDLGKIDGYIQSNCGNTEEAALVETDEEQLEDTNTTPGREDEEVEGEVEGPPPCILAEYQSMSQ